MAKDLESFDLCDQPILKSHSPTRSTKKPDTLLSSLGGFSHGGPQNIRSLHDLLQAIQPLHLELFQGSALPESDFLGEGASYRVRKCVHHGAQGEAPQVYAVKEVKLPMTSDQQAFQTRVAFVLKDIEVMSHRPLADCPQILDLFGYGWRNQRGDIPFLVTEYAPYGTLRQYLTHNLDLSGRKKLQLCRDVGAALEMLHTSGVFHGDLKLENVLVTPGINAKNGEEVVVAKISDFGHSLLASMVDDNATQRYLGSALYQPPEVTSNTFDATDPLNFQKCDLWTFGLLCWEVMNGGTPYYENDRMYRLLWQLDREPRDGPESRHATAQAVVKYMSLVNEQIPAISHDFARGLLCNIVPPFTQQQLARVLHETLVLKPQDRAFDVAALPLAWGARLVLAAPAKKLADRTARISDWGYDCFQKTASCRILWSAKVQMVSDFQRSCTVAGKSQATARAALQLALAYFMGFGVKRDLAQFRKWLQTSSNLGLVIAQHIKTLIDFQHSTESLEELPRDAETIPTASNAKDSVADALERRKSIACGGQYLDFVRTCFRASSPPSISSSVTQPFLTSDISSLELSQKLYGACRRGDAVTTDTLLAAGARPDVVGSDGTTILHWLFMFPEDVLSPMAHKLFARVRRQSATRRSDGLGEGVQGDESFLSWVNHAVSVPIFADPQLPVRVSGTPLTTAVAVGCLPMAEVLLAVGANWRYNFGDDLPQERPECPWTLAAYLCLPDLFRLMHRHALNPLWTSKLFNTLLITLFEGVACASSFELQLLHGGTIGQAQGDVIDALHDMQREPSSSPEPGDRLCRLLNLAVTFGDHALLRLLQQRFREALEEHREQQPTLLEMVILEATETACRAIYDPQASIKLISGLTKAKGMADATHRWIKRPLNIVIQHQKEDLFEWLLLEGAELNVQDEQGVTPLHQMISYRVFKEKHFERMVSLGASIDTPDQHGVVPLHTSLRHEVLAIAEFLLRHGADVNVPDRKSNTAIHFAATSSDSAILTAVLAAKPRLNVHGQDDMTELSMACAAGRMDNIRLLLEAGSNATLAIDTAIQSGDTAILSTLLDHGGDVSSAIPASRRHRYPPISRAAHRGDVAMLRLLLAAGISPSLRDDRQRTALHCLFLGMMQHRHSKLHERKRSAASPQYELALDILIPLAREGGWLEAVDDFNRTCLHYASMCASLGVGRGNVLSWQQFLAMNYSKEARSVALLIENGLDPNAADVYRETCLHYAAAERHLPNLWALALAGTPGINLRNHLKCTPLHVAIAARFRPASAVMGERQEIIMNPFPTEDLLTVLEDDAQGLAVIHACFILVQCGASPIVKNIDDEIPLALAACLPAPHQREFLQARMRAAISPQAQVGSATPAQSLRRALRGPAEDTGADEMMYVLLAAAQVKVNVANGRSALQLWAGNVQATAATAFEPTVPWPRDGPGVERLGDLLLTGGADLLATTLHGRYDLSETPLAVACRAETTVRNNELVAWLFKAHIKVFDSLSPEWWAGSALPRLPISLVTSTVENLVERHAQTVRYVIGKYSARTSDEPGLVLESLPDSATIFPDLLARGMF